MEKGLEEVLVLTLSPSWFPRDSIHKVFCNQLQFWSLTQTSPWPCPVLFAASLFDLDVPTNSSIGHTDSVSLWLGSPQLYSWARSWQLPWTNIFPVASPQRGPQSWGPLGKALLSPLGSSSRKTCTIIQWSVGLKSQAGSLPSPPPFQAPDGDTSCTASTFYGSLRCPKGPPNSWRLSGEEAEVRLLPISGAFPSQICHLLPLIIILSCLA